MRVLFIILLFQCVFINNTWSQDVLINQIEVLGVKSISEDDILGSLEVDVGDRFNRSRVLQSSQNIQALYQVRGYEQVSVKTTLVGAKGETVLRFSIEEGIPTRVVSVKIILDNESFIDPKVLKQIKSRVLLSPGEFFDQEKITLAKRGVIDFLGTHHYIGAHFGELSAQTVQKSGIPENIKNLNAHRWVEVEIPLSLGDRVLFGFRGNTFFSNSELRDLIQEQRTVGLTSDFIDQIKNRFMIEYQKNAFTHVSIESITLEKGQQNERRVSYFINEGQKYKLATIEFEGNHAFSSKQLRDIFLKNSNRLMQRGYYVSQEVDFAVEALVQWLKGQGYLFARVITTNKVLVSGKNAYKVLIYLYEGDQTLVQSIRLRGFSVLSEKEILSLIGVKEGLPLNPYRFTEGLEYLKESYRSKGYLDFKILNESTEKIITYSSENRLAEINLEVVEGALYRISRIEIDGLTKTKKDVVERELRFKAGDVLEEPLLSESQSRLRRLGIFSSVTFRDIQDPEFADRKIIKISLQEGTPGVIGAGVGYRNDLGPRVFGQIGYVNLHGKNHGINLTTSLNRNFDRAFCDNSQFNASQGVTTKTRLGGSANCFLEYRVELSYLWPWFMLGETTFRPEISLQRVQYYRFDSDIASFSASLERKLFNWSRLSGALTYSLERVSQFNAPEVDEGVFRIGALIPGARLDLRDNPLAPSRGVFFSTSYELARDFFLSQTSPVPIAYDRWQFRGDFHYSLWNEIGLYFSFRTGIAWNRAKPPAASSTDQRYQIPIIKQFTLGGVGSLRGFREQALNFADISINGRMSFVNYRTQIDFPFVGALKAGPFLDAGNIRINDFGFGRLRYGAGFGFRYQSPVGPINFDWGFNLKPQVGEDQSRFYFSVGII